MDVLIDADILIYRAGFATHYPKYSVHIDTDVEFDEVEVAEFNYKKEAVAFMTDHGIPPEKLHVDEVIEPLENALHVMDSMLYRIAGKYGVPVQGLTVVISGTSNFREKVAVTKRYKGNRTKPKPQHYGALRTHLLDRHQAVTTANEEADDWLGYTQYAKWYFSPEDTVIVTIDKDLDMIPGRHYNPVKEEEYYIEEEEADRAFLYQLIAGDRADNIPGIPGMAEGKAKTALESIPTDEALPVIRDLYVRAYGDEARTVMDEQATLLWIRRVPDQKWTEYWTDWEELWQDKPEAEQAHT